MKNSVLLLIGSTLALTSAMANEEKPKVTFCASQQSAQMADSVSVSLQETRVKVSELAHNDPIVMCNFDTLSDILNTAFHKEKSMTEAEVQQICKGIEFSAEKHRLQTRKDAAKTPYISHPLAVSTKLMGVGQVRDAQVIIGALLHDTVEDTQTTFEEIEGKFGQQVAALVREVTDDKTLSKEERKRFQVINASHKSSGAAQIKLADKLSNLSDLLQSPPQDWTQARIDQYYQWAQSVVDRLPKASDPLHDAVVQTINAYWEKQQDTK
jgi:hypothetical protein